MPPVLVREEAMYGTGFFPSDEERLLLGRPEDGLYLVGTSEVPLIGMHMGEILERAAAPLLRVLVVLSARGGSGRKDTRGMFRVHQFQKVEMFAYTRPEDSWEVHERCSRSRSRSCRRPSSRIAS